jgi:peptidoglycan/LPS O-acetylase OafA/YrhL
MISYKWKFRNFHIGNALIALLVILLAIRQNWTVALVIYFMSLCSAGMMFNRGTKMEPIGSEERVFI